MYEIENNVPVARKNFGARYPLESIQPGQCFFIPVEDPAHKKREVNRVCTATSYFRRTYNPAARFVTRQVEGGVRVWRIE